VNFDLDKWKQDNFGTTSKETILGDLVASKIKPTIIIDHYNKLINENP